MCELGSIFIRGNKCPQLPETNSCKERTFAFKLHEGSLIALIRPYLEKRSLILEKLRKVIFLKRDNSS